MKTLAFLIGLEVTSLAVGLTMLLTPRVPEWIHLTGVGLTSFGGCAIVSSLLTKAMLS